MSYGRLSETFWKDPDIRALSESARYFMLYLISCPHGNRLGLFVLQPLYASADLMWTTDQVEEALQELQTAGRILRDEPNHVVLVRYYLRHNRLTNQSVVKGGLTELGAVPPDTPLLGDLLDIVRDEMKGPSGPRFAHYGELVDELEELVGVDRARKAQPNAKTRASTGRAHSAGHSDPHSEAHHREGEGREGGGIRQTPDLLPHPPDPSLPDPPLPSPGEDGENLVDEVRAALPTARGNIVYVHGGTERPVTIAGHEVGLGIEIKRFRRICQKGHDPPLVIARAIRYIPTVTGLDTPVSLARWEAEDGGPIYERCVALAYQDDEPAEPVVEPKRIAPKKSAERSARQEELMRQVEQLRGEAIDLP